MLYHCRSEAGRLAQIVLCVFLVIAFATFARSDAAEKPNAAERSGVARAPKDFSAIAADRNDAARLKALSYRLADWEQSSAETSEQGLTVKATFIPDALAYQVATTYLKIRERGANHPEAIQRIANSLPRWKRFEENSGFLVEIKNERFRLGGENRRVYTLEKRVDRAGITVKGNGKRRLPVSLAGKPSGLRFTKLRIKKFWRTGDKGVVRRARSPDDPLRRNPASVGKKAMISKPFTSRVVEEKPVQMQLLVRRELVQEGGGQGFRIDFQHWKRYEGPFVDDLLDLNERRLWKPLKGLYVKASLPPLGMRVSPELQALVKEARRLVVEG